MKVEATAPSQCLEVEASVANLRDETTLDRFSWDKFKSSYGQNAVVMLEYRKGKGKNIHAEKVTLFNFPEDLLQIHSILVFTFHQLSLPSMFYA